MPLVRPFRCPWSFLYHKAVIAACLQRAYSCPCVFFSFSLSLSRFPPLSFVHTLYTYLSPSTYLHLPISTFSPVLPSFFVPQFPYILLSDISQYALSTHTLLSHRVSPLFNPSSSFSVTFPSLFILWLISLSTPVSSSRCVSRA